MAKCVLVTAVGIVRLSRYDVHVLARHQEVHAALVDWQTFQSGAGVGLTRFRHDDPVIITGRKGPPGTTNSPVPGRKRTGWSAANAPPSGTGSPTSRPGAS
ncbi:hypothetical protein [Streptomyces sp. NPDC046925]|uniref:hypothetical protein n=1 Tax=Streptomyces sp. NPDC046925 TaxID=3155375 RepID=UPI003407F934